MVGDLTLDFSKNETQRQFMYCSTKFQNYCGGFGSGKTTACLAKMLILCAKMPGSVWEVYRKTYPDLRDTTQKTFNDIVPKDWIEKEMVAQNRVILKNKSEILFRYFDTGDVKVGSNISGFFLDQAEEAPEEVFNALIGRLRHNRVPRHYGLTAMNPNGMDWQYNLFVKSNDPEYSNFDSTTYDNEANLPVGYIDSMLKRYGRDWAERFILGKWSTMSGLIFHEFDPKVNTCDAFEIPKDWIKVRGMDWGIDAPATAVLITRSPEGIIYVVNEYGDKEKTPQEHAREIISRSEQFPGIRASILDSSAFHRESDMKSIADQYRSSGIHTLPATRDIMARIALVKNLLKTGNLVFINGETEETQKELRSWKWGSKRKGVEVPAHGNDHYLDALGYAVYWISNRLVSGSAPQEVVEDKLVGKLGFKQESGCDSVTGMPL